MLHWIPPSQDFMASPADANFLIFSASKRHTPALSTSIFIQFKCPSPLWIQGQCWGMNVGKERGHLFLIPTPCSSTPPTCPPTSSESFAVLKAGRQHSQREQKLSFLILTGCHCEFCRPSWQPTKCCTSWKILWQAHHWEATSHGKTSSKGPFPISLNSCPYIIHPTDFYCWGLFS